MLERLQEMLSTRCGLQPGMQVVVGVSGGPDSLTLLDILHRLGFFPVVAHLNHQLRPEAAEEARVVRDTAQRLGLIFVEKRTDVKAHARELGLSIEEAGRNLRYRFLFDLAADSGSHAVAVAHTADDQVETVLMHILRGAGLSGLKGMLPRTQPTPWSREIPLIRPLLDTWRSEVLSYCEERGLEPVFDPSNLDSTFYRNRLRNELIPYLESYNPGVKATFWRMAKVLQADFEVIERQVEATWAASVIESGPGYVAMVPMQVRSAPAGVQRHLFRKAIARLRPGLRDIDFETVDRAVNFLLNAASPAQMDLAAGLLLVLEDFSGKAGHPVHERLWLADWHAKLPRGDWPEVGEEGWLPLPVPGSVDLAGDWVLEIREVQDLEDARRQARANTNPYQAWISLEETQGSLWMRARRTGDRFQPLGLGGHSVKLSDFMIDQKLPRRARLNWPLVLAGEEIAWIPGFRLGHNFRLNAETIRAVHLSLRQARSDASA